VTKRVVKKNLGRKISKLNWYFGNEILGSVIESKQSHGCLGFTRGFVVILELG
jgi:hypothetical protein